MDSCGYISDEYVEEFDPEESDSQIGSGKRITDLPGTPVRRPTRYQPLAKRCRPMCEPNYSPYPLVPSREVQHTSQSGLGWYEHDGQIRFLIESQTKMMKMIEKMSERIAVVEKAVLGINASPSSTGSCASPEEKKRIPNQLSVGFLNNVVSSASLHCNFSGLWLCYGS